MTWNKKQESSKNPSVGHEEVKSCQEPCVVTVRSLAGPKTIFLGHITNVSCCLRINFDSVFREKERDVGLHLIVHMKTKQNKFA